VQAAGIDDAVLLRFDSAMRQMTPAAFLGALAPEIELRGVAMTAGSAFGRDRAGTLEHVASIGAQRGFEAIEVAALVVDGATVSSSRIREALAAGEVPVATRLLGAEPLLRGTVVHGEGRGRRLGFPTANLSFDYPAALPAHGIYLGHVDVPAAAVGPGHPALVSVGVRPTFHEHAAELVEVYLLDWEGDLYDLTLTLRLGPRLRGERRFASVDALIEQMRVDEANARRRFASV
jgi:riboflavin kinase / FMN adenylyltransferase